MTIGIDIDDTITNSSEVITDYIMKYSDNVIMWKGREVDVC